MLPATGEFPQLTSSTTIWEPAQCVEWRVLDMLTASGRCVASWQVTMECNYRCSYCFDHQAHADTSFPIAVDDAIRVLRNTGRSWIVCLVGGEVFLIPGFVDACNEMIRADIRVAIETNLSLEKPVIDFANRVNPSGIEDIAVSLHVEERTRRHDVRGMIDRVRLLRMKGFPLSTIGYVLHPRLLTRWPEDRDWFAEQGIDLVPAPFVGEWKGRHYPEAYCRDERQLLLAGNALAGVVQNFPSRGMLCNAGRSFVRIDKNGNVWRCNGVQQRIGHISDSIELSDSARSCPVAICPCWGWMLIEQAGLQEQLTARFLEGAVGKPSAPDSGRDV
jgi:MoaA/NifB/PqqE/SkfB family radical SAM enzyme